MARPKKDQSNVVVSHDEIQDAAPIECPKASVSGPQKILARIVQLGIGVDLLGSQTSLQAKRGNELEVTPIGVVATSGKNQRRILIPWANIRGVELEKA